MALWAGEAKRVSPPLREGATRAVATRVTAGQRPPGRGGRWRETVGPRLVLIPARRLDRGDGPCHWSGEGAFGCSGGNRKRTAFPPPLRDSAL